MAYGRNLLRGTTLACMAIGTLSGVGIVGTARAEDGEWIKDDKGCKVWSDAKAEERGQWSATWTGQCKKGVAEGPGALNWYKNDILAQRYEGPLINGKRDGTGVYTWVSGGRYEGQFTAGARTGHAKYHWPNGDNYEGDFVNGKRTGKGVYIWANGQRYEGDFVDSAMTGEGYQLEPNGNTYRGRWLNDQFNGPGVVTFAATGNVLSGQFVDGKIHDGTGSKADGTLIAIYSNGVRSNPTSSDGGGSNALSFVAGLLGAAAQGVAGAGGRNAAQYQAVATALQAASGTSNSGTLPVAQPIAAAPGGAAYGGAGTNAAAGRASGATDTNPLAGRKTIAPETNCIDQVRIKRGERGWVGWSEVETGMMNKCGYTVNTAWCITNAQGNGDSARCETQYSGMYGLSPGEQHSMHVDRFGALQTLSCKEPAMPLNIKWNGTTFTGQCYLPKA